MNERDVRVTRITIYPMKSLAGIEVSNAAVLDGGVLQFDRRWAIMDRQGKFVNGKRTSRIHELVADFDLTKTSIRIGSRDDDSQTAFSLVDERAGLGRWLSKFFGYEVSVVENSEVGFPDDLEAPGPTVISTETLAEIASWFDGLTLDDVRHRFRANIELATSGPFWEDCLFGSANSPVHFRMGNVCFEGTNPCARCVVPSRDPNFGTVYPGFAAEFAKRREASLPSWTEPTRFDHFYRAAVNTRLVEALLDREIRLGQAVTLV